MKKILSIAILSCIAFPVFANAPIPLTPADADRIILSVRTKPYTVKVPQCKSDRILLRAIATDYRSSEMQKVEEWKANIEKTQSLTAQEKKDYDYVKSAFNLEVMTPKYRTWYVCDDAITVFKENIDIQKETYQKQSTTLISEYKTANITTGTNGIQTFISPSLNTQVAVIEQKDLKKYSTELAKFEYIIKVKSANSITVMMKNNVVNKKMANFYGTPINSVSVLSLQKIYSSYVSEANKLAVLFGWKKSPIYPKSTKVWSIYFIEM